MPRSQIIDVATQSLANPYGLSTLPPELYVPLWLYSGANVSTTITSGTSYLAKGRNTAGSAGTLLTVGSNWPPGTKVAFEASIWNAVSSTTTTANLVQAVSPYTVYATITTSASTATVVRSSTFTIPTGQPLMVQILTSNSTYSAFITDASLIVFPNQQLLAQGSLSNITLGTVGQKLTESQIPLWVCSSGTVSTTASSSGSAIIQKGSTSTNNSTAINASNTLYKLGTNWSPSQKFALEVSGYNATSGQSINVALWNTGGNTLVPSSQLTITSTTSTVLRSGSFTLPTNQSYGITMWSSGSGTNFISKAHLVPLFT